MSSTPRDLRSDDDAVACWAALVAYVEDVHAPQDNLTEEQWQAAWRVAESIPFPAPSVQDKILSIAPAVMLGDCDAPDMPESDWRVADRMLAEYTARVEAVPA